MAGVISLTIGAEARNGRTRIRHILMLGESSAGTGAGMVRER
jgi:hypothetical protein